MADIFKGNHRCYGYRRMQASLARRCLHLSEKVIQREADQDVPWLAQSGGIPAELASVT